LSKGIGSVAVLKVNNDYGTGLYPAFERKYSQNGLIVLYQSYASNQRDFKTELSKIKASNAQAIYLVSYAPDAEVLVKQIEELGIELPLFAAEPIENNAFLKNTGSAAEGIVYLKAALTTPKGTAFVQKAKAEIGRYPETNIARAYDALHVAAKAIQVCDASNRLTGECVKEQLYNTNFEGVLGQIRFDRNGDVRIPYALKTIRNGEFVLYSNA